MEHAVEPEVLVERFRRVRRLSAAICAPLALEDHVVQTQPEVSPPRWHLAHVTWYFETFVLRRADPARAPHHPGYHALFNSYYQGVGLPFPRARRGTLSRPTVAEVHAYRGAVDGAIERLIGALGRHPDAAELAFRLELGLHHEQQHQELLLMDIKHILGSNPLHPPYRAEPATPRAPGAPAPTTFLACPGGVVALGAAADGFAFDNERPRHEVLLGSHALADRLVTNGEFLEFVEDGGYRRPELWLADGWARVQEEGWSAPLYWRPAGEGRWSEYSLAAGLAALDLVAPVAHVSHYEADAFARWAGARLPSEAEWEAAAAALPPEALARANLLDDPGKDPLHPRAAATGGGFAQLLGDLWEHTASSYGPYPGYAPFAGELGEYNGKFMCNQHVLRGGCCATPRDHLRATYRNFFYPHDRWPFAGIRLAK